LESTSRSVAVFIGPTEGKRKFDLTDQYVRMPPVQHGDLFALVRDTGIRTAVIVDGFFHQRPAIRHKEILWAIDSGVRVIGAASMGALRAAELDSLGMEGVGRIYRSYACGARDRDDDVVVAHGSAPAYEPLSIATVNVQEALDRLVAEEKIDSAVSDVLLGRVRALPYGSRTAELILATSGAEHPREAERLVARLEAPGGECDLKRHDAALAIEYASNAIPPDPRVARCPSVQTTLSTQWRLAASSGREPSAQLIRRYGQLYSEGFPLAWSDYVRDRPRSARLSAVLSHTDVDLAYWCTPAELSALERAGAIALAETRSLERKVLETMSIADIQELLPCWRDLTREVTEAIAVEQAVRVELRIPLGSSVGETSVAEQLIYDWAAGTSLARLDAVSRDRGFRGFGDACEAAKDFHQYRRLLRYELGQGRTSR